MVCHANGNNCTRRDIVTAGTGYTAQNPMSMGINAIINIVLRMTSFHYESTSFCRLQINLLLLLLIPDVHKLCPVCHAFLATPTCVHAI